MTYSSTHLLQIVDLCCERDGRYLIENMNLTVEEGAIYQFEGPNGCGKTTLLRVLCGLSARFQGQLLWQGSPIDQQRTVFNASLLYLGHSTGVKAALSPRENLQWHASIKGLSSGSAHIAIDQALAKVGLYGYEDSPCYTLSMGQQRRVGLARLFIGKPSLWVLDEPFSAIDKEGVAQLEQWIAEFAQAGGSVILTTHHELKVSYPVQYIRLGD